MSIRIRAARKRDGLVATDGEVVAEFWAPGRDPVHDPDTRSRPDYTAECSYDEKSRSWVATAETDGWSPGTWTVRGRTLARFGPAEQAAGWDWRTFLLAA